MRFAGTRIEGFLGDKPDYGALASGADSLRSKESQAATGLMGKTAAAGISAAGQVKGAEITGAAQEQMASAQSQAAMMGMFGKIAGAGIGAAGKAGLFGGSPFANNTNDFSVGDATTMGMSQKQADWLSKPGNFTETVIDGSSISTPTYGSWDDL